MKLGQVVWLFVLAAPGYAVTSWLFPGYGIWGLVLGAVIAILFRGPVASVAPRFFEQPGGGRLRRIFTYCGLFVALALFGSCAWTLAARSWSTRERPAQILARLEATYNVQFPTNMQIVNSKAWWESTPRTSNTRYTALHARCDTTSWTVLRNVFATNFYRGEFIEPYGRNLHSHAPWITTVKSNWDRYSEKFETRDPKDHWLRVHWCDIYFAPPVGTNQDVVVLVWDTRSEVNW